MALRVFFLGSGLSLRVVASRGGSEGGFPGKILSHVLGGE